MSNLYEVKALLNEANEYSNMAEYYLKTMPRTKQNRSMGNKLIGKAIQLEQKAEVLYADIVGANLHHKELYDLFGIK